MLELITFKPALGCISPSPFGVKAEALLTMSGLPFEKTYGDIRKAPRGKFPILKVGQRIIPDTAHIQTYLENEQNIDFDSGLNSTQLATALAFRRMVEHHFYFINAHFRWNDHPETVKSDFFGEIPALMRGFIFKMVKKNLDKTIHLQGLGRHTREELISFARQDVDAIAVQLADKKFFMDDVPTSIDATIYGALHNLIDNKLDTPVKRACLEHDNLVAYCKRFAETVFDTPAAP